MSYHFPLINIEQAHSRMVLAWRWLKPQLEAGLRFELSIDPEARTPEQNAAQWPVLEAFSKQLKWPVNGERVEMTPEEWKDVMSAAFEHEAVRLAQGLDGGVVMLGRRTSKYGKAKFSEWLDFLKSTAAERGIDTGEPIP